MPGERLFDNAAIALNQSDSYLERPRLQKLLESAMDYPMVIVCAGAGYGKTRAVNSYVRKHAATTAWVQLSEPDNVATRFWENYSNMLSLSWPEYGRRICGIGFPETDEAFSKYIAVMREITVQPGKHIRVFDDFHLIHNPAVLRFFERAVDMIPSNVTLLLISRTVPEINMVGLIMRDRVFTINEDMLCFTEEEIAEYFGQLKLPATRGTIRNIFHDTQGWAFAVNLIGRSLTKEQKYERSALEAMKKNIFRLIDAEISGTVSGTLLRFLMRISLIDHLAASLVNVLAKDDAELIKEMEQVNAYIRYDYHIDAYLIHHLFRDYLRQHSQSLTAEERKETYQAAGEWCDANGYHIDAFSYYEKSGDFTAITKKVASLNVQLPQDMAEYALGIFDRAPDEVKAGNPIFPSMYLKLKISLGQLDEAEGLARRYAEEFEAHPESPARNRGLTAIYAVWALLRMDMCTYTDVYDFDFYFQKMSENYDKSPFALFGAYKSMSAISWASLVGTNRAGALEEYIDAAARAIPYVSHVLNGGLTGYDDLLRGELCFCRGEFDAAEQYLKQSIGKARTNDQYVTLNRALTYLMRIAFFRGDLAGATARLEEMEELLSEKDYGVRYSIYDVACGVYKLYLGQPEQIPEWLKGDFSPYTHPSFLENYANRMKTRYHYETRKYRALLAYIENESKRTTILYGNIELTVLKALVLSKLKRRGEAIAALTEAYGLAESNRTIVIFTQYAKDMRMLTAAALKDEGCAIPKAWLENVNRKASAYAKRIAAMVSEYRAAHHTETEIALTEREINILRDLSQGLSRSEIAASQNISVNTVKMFINIIYYKLGVSSLPDAIRVAVNQKLV